MSEPTTEAGRRLVADAMNMDEPSFPADFGAAILAIEADARAAALAEVVWWPDREALTAALAEALHIAGLGVGCDAAFADGTLNSQGLHLTVHQRQAAAIVAAMLPEERP